MMVKGYKLEQASTDKGLWFLVDPESDKICATFFRNGGDMWRGKGPCGLVGEFPIDDDADEPQRVAALKFVEL